MAEPRCAVCVAPITKQEQFVLSGTEAFHLRCLKARGTMASVGNRRKQLIADQQAEVQRLKAELELVQARLRAKELLEQDASRLREQLHEHTRLVDDYRTQRDRARRERDEAVAARDAAKRELALMQELGHKPQQADPATQQEEGVDASAARFSLLEFD